MILQIALTAHDGSLLVASGGGGDQLLANNRLGAGPWEIFKLFNQTRPGTLPQHGDTVVLKVTNGQFISAVGGGGGLLNAASESVDNFAKFILERIDGAGPVQSGDRVAFKTVNNYYVSADGGGVNAVVLHRDTWETFTIRIFQPQLVRLRASTSGFVTAEGGGGSVLTANRSFPGLWETFSLINLSRSDRSIRPGDQIALQAWNGNYLRVTVPDTVRVNANQMIPEAQFRVGVSGTSPSAIRSGQRISLQSSTSSRYLVARTGTVSAGATTAVREAYFTLNFAEQSGISFDLLPDGSSLPGRPFETRPLPVSGERNLLTLHIYDTLAVPPIMASNEQIAEAIFGRAPSLASWLETMSDGIFTVRNAGVYGPIRLWSVGAIYEDISLLLTAAYNAGVPLASFTNPGGMIDNNRVKLVKMGTGGGGRTHHATGLGRGGIRFDGEMVGVGVSADVNEGSRMVLCHEISHLLLNVQDRYGMRRPLRGDVVANRTRVGDWERFIIERVDGPGRVNAGDRIMLRAHDGTYLAIAPEAPHLINLEGPDAGIARVFSLTNLRDGDLISGSRIALRAHNGQYMSALLGGNSVVMANVSWFRGWEEFEIRKFSGSGQIASGEAISLRTGLGNYYLVAETGSRDRPRGEAIDANDRRRGYLWGAGAGYGGNFDNASANYHPVMLALYDRIRLGWVRPRYLTPDNRGCYLLRPFIDYREALILFDPQNPKEWYTVENRQYRENIDEVPSSGIVISWVCEDETYWRWWFERANDPEWGGRYPAVISAVTPGVPPNMMALPLVLNPDELTQRNNPRAAFTNQEIVLPLGNGDPSRFHLSFHSLGSGNISICIR